jgi:hypothetical protein
LERLSLCCRCINQELFPRSSISNLDVEACILGIFNVTWGFNELRRVELCVGMLFSD